MPDLLREKMRARPSCSAILFALRPRLRLFVCASVSLGLCLAACGSDSGADPGASAVPVGDDGKTIAATKDGITAYLTAGDYKTWAKEAATHGTVRAHGSQVRNYFNAKYLGARRSSAYPMPVGAMCVKELYSSDSLYGYAVAVKSRAGEGADTWTWYETTGLPDVKYFGVANSTCEGCHAADGGRDRSLTTGVP